MPYEIKKRGDQWCVFKEGSDESLGCHETKGGAQGQIQAIGAATHASLWITLEEMRGLCPECAVTMQARGLSKVNLAELRQMPAQMLQGLCNRVGSDPGFFTRCMGMSFGDFAPADKKGFCAWLHKECTGIWPGEHSVGGHLLRQDDKIAHGGALRALGNGKVGGYLVMFSPGGEPKDAYGTYFERDTEYGWEVGEQRIALYDHGMDPTLGARSVGDGWTLRRVDDVGEWVESQLNLADEYEARIYDLIAKGHPDDGRSIMGLSSGVAEHLIVTDEDGRMRRWIISEGSYTVVPAEPRTRGEVCALRTYKPTSLKSLLDNSGNRTEDAPKGDPAGRKRAGTAGIEHNRQSTTKTPPKHRGPGGKRKMDISKLIEMLKGKLELTEEQLATLDLIAEAYAMGNSGEMPTEEYPMEGDMLDAQGVLSLLKKLSIEAQAKADPPLTIKVPKPEFRGQHPPYSFEAAQQEDDEAKKKAEVLRSVHIMRRGEIDKPTDLVMREVYAGDYRQALYDQEVAFMRYLRTGREDPILQRQLWGIRNVRDMLKGGMSVAKIRATMVEGADELGGYAVPPDMQAEIIRRIMGLTAIRGGGALVVQTASNMIEWIKITGGSDRYPSGMRGQWGDETTDGTGDDFSLGLVQIPVQIYSYYVDFSRALLEDAANLEQIFTNLVSDTLAIDEDEAFLIGDGANKPRGILPANANTDSITEKALSLNGAGTDITVEGVKGLRRGVASQYRNKARASWIANSATGEVIELFQDGEGRFYYQYLEHGEYFLMTPWRESEAMPDIGSNSYPMIFGDLSGYAIIERLGMAIERFHDSNTGVKKYRFAIYRRLGGRLIEPWKIAVGKVATSV